MIEANPHFLPKKTKKILFGGSLSATKCHWCKAQARNLSAISPKRNAGFKIISGESPDIMTGQIHLAWSNIVSGESNL